MPYEASLKLKESRAKNEEMDQLESSKEHLLRAERAYLELSDKYDFYKIECAIEDDAKSIENINLELYDYIIKQLEK